MPAQPHHRTHQHRKQSHGDPRAIPERDPAVSLRVCSDLLV